LLTGMSGVGKSTIVEALHARGHRAVDTDERAYRIAPDGDWLWDEREIDRLLSADDVSVIFIAGCASNQVQFYGRFHQIVLLSAATDVMVERLRSRTNNPYGGTDQELARILSDKATYEPMLRRVAHHEIETDRSLEKIVDEILELGMPGETAE
jgi:dephospho-CoA kinase